MATVYLTSTATNDPERRPNALDELNRMRSSADSDIYDVHAITDNPKEADIILFVENCNTITHLKEVKELDIYKNYRYKIFLFSRDDFPIPFFPGIYPSMPSRWYSEQRTRTGPYLISFDADFIRPDDSFSDIRYLSSFVGKRITDPVRDVIFSQSSDAIYARDTSHLWPYGNLSPDQRTGMQESYVNTCHQSLFVLCPRGLGASSIRLFESMRMGRAPVIISDEWIPPQGPNWDDFSIRIGERHASEMPDILKEYEDSASTMGRTAREVWCEWFSREATFHRCIDWCLQIQESRRYPESLLRLTVLLQFSEPRYFKMGIRKFLLSR